MRLDCTRFWRCVGTAFGYFNSGSHNFMVTALRSCVKWPLTRCLRYVDGFWFIFLVLQLLLIEFTPKNNCVVLANL
jgi:hypothetical protein